MTFKFEKVNVPENNSGVNITVQTIENNAIMDILIKYCRRRKLNRRFLRLSSSK